MNEVIESSCPYCAAPVELLIDESGGSHQEFIEDCPICCRPWEVEVMLSSDGVWHADLRSDDE